MQSDKLREECAVFGVSLCTCEAAGVTYNGLLALQHRGQEGAGIAVVRDGKIVCKKGVGFVNEVFSKSTLESMPKGKIALGHSRYSTTGSNSEENVGPFVTEYLTGRIATAHNGNVTNAKKIREELSGYGIKFDATSDSEVISSLIAYYLTKENDIVSAAVKACDLLSGAFSLIVAGGGKLIAVRDPDGYRPLCIGESDIGYAVASESCALDACGFKFVRDVLPGEVVKIENGRMTSEAKLAEREKKHGLCIFEYVYFSRPDSVVDGLSVYEARVRMGGFLAEEHPADADIVCGVPDSGLEAAAGFAARSGLPLVSGFVKNRYLGRSFIYPVQSERENIVRLKLNPLSGNVAGKRVVLVDDSIVRGTTSEKIIKNLKNAGAKEVHLRISSPPFLHTCHYGTDIDSEENLIANRLSQEEIRRKIGADSLGYISMQGLKKACEKCALPFCTACFTGDDSIKTKKNILE